MNLKRLIEVVLTEELHVAHRDCLTGSCAVTGSCVSQIVQMNNYFGLGIDAELSLDFHQAREDEPDKFTSR